MTMLGTLIREVQFEDLIKVHSGTSNCVHICLSPCQVEETWKSLEFTVIPHNDCKDVYILGRTEEIQQVLDDSFININTIASSRYVGPIEMQVENWLCQLELFSKTLVSEHYFCYLKVCFF